MYCPSPTCSKFLGSVKVLPRTTACPTCLITVCTHCRKHAHPLRFFCQQEDETGALQGLLEQNKWQRCPNCRAVVELNQGCYHITCRCRSQFCYLCSAPWKTCNCRQWDERMLVAEAERRVDAQVRLRAVQPQPVQPQPVQPQPRPAAVPVTAAPLPLPEFLFPDLHRQLGSNNRVADASNEPRQLVGSSSHPSSAQIAAGRSSANGSIGQRAGNLPRHEPLGERGSSPFEQEGYGSNSQSGTRPGRNHWWAVEEGPSQGYQSYKKPQERSGDDWRQKRVKEMMERLRTDHDCNPHDWHKRNGGGECSECHHRLPLYLLVSASIFKRDRRLKYLSALQKLLPSSMCEVRKKSPLRGCVFGMRDFRNIQHRMSEVHTGNSEQGNKTCYLDGGRGKSICYATYISDDRWAYSQCLGSEGRS